jgi:zinc protease
VKAYADTSYRALVAVTVTVAVLAAVAPARAESPPAPAPAQPFNLPARHDLALANGGKVTLLPFGAVAKALVTWTVRAGNVHEGEQQVWLADTTGEMLSEGTKSQSSAQLAQAAADMGGDVSFDVGPDQTTVSLEVLAEFAPRAVALVGDMVKNPLFPADHLPHVLADMSRKLAMARTQPDVLAREQLDGTLYPNHAYGRVLPTEAMLASFTIDDVRKFYAANFGAARSQLYVVGQFDAAAVEAAARQSLGAWRRGPEPTPIAALPEAPPALRQVDRPGAVQSTLAVGLPVVAPQSDDYVALEVTDALLGGAFGSRITTNLREQKGYTYSPYSSVDTMDHNASWRELADVTTNVTGASLTEIFKEVSRLQKEPPPAAELRGIQQYLAGTFVIANSSRAGIVRRLRFVDLQQLDAGWLRDYVRRVMAVTPADVQRIAQQYLDPKKMTIVVIGDRKQVDRQLAPWRKPPPRRH